MTLLRLKELANNRLTDAQLLAIKEEVKAECVRAVESKYHSSDKRLMIWLSDVIKAIKEV